MPPHQMQYVFLKRLLFTAWSALALCAGVQGEEPVPDYYRDVMPVLSKSGCNMGLCHGNQNGKGGFRLSLRGQDPEADYQQLVRDLHGRRINRIEPAESLLLQKPLGAVAHGGGVRFRRENEPYKILLNWIRAGLPKPSKPNRVVALSVDPPSAIVTLASPTVQLQVTAEDEQGRTRDVTPLSVFECGNLVTKISPLGLVHHAKQGQTTVMVRYLDKQVPVRVSVISGNEKFVWSNPTPANYVDQHIYRQLLPLELNPANRSSDLVFLRRLYLDVLGILPTAEEAQAFARDTAPNKRARVIDRVLARTEFADFWALKWSDVLRNEEKTLDGTGVKKFHDWIRTSIANGKPLDQFVRELVSTAGSTYNNPATNYYRANRNPTARSEATARLFLGYRLQCARCHNHPFDRWTQDDYYQWAAIFSRIDYKIVNNKRRDKFDKNEFVGEQLVLFTDKGEVKNERTGNNASPKLLGAQKVDDQDSHRIEKMASWLGSKDNRQFARVQANMIWYHLMGKGLVDPIDDFRVTNPPVNGSLLDALTDQLIHDRFDLRSLIRTILNSNAYQAGLAQGPTRDLLETQFAACSVRRLSAEQLLDAQSYMLGVPAKFAGYPVGLRATQIPGVQKHRARDVRPLAGDRFLKLFGKPRRLLSCECERSNETTLGQAFLLVGADSLQKRLGEDGGFLAGLAESGKSHEQIIDALVWRALTRPPSDHERQNLKEHLDKHEPLEGIQDIAWALLNAKEFLFRH